MNCCGPLLRGSALWLAVTAVAAGGARLARGDALALRHGVGAADLEALLVRACAAAVVGCLGWGWLVTSAVLVEAVAGAAVPGVPPAVRRAVLAACGLALAGGLAAPAGAATVGPSDRDVVGRGGGAAVLDGLPLPDRATGRSDPVPARSVTVRCGDSLWLIAARDLPPGAGPATVASRVAALHERNRAVIGPDPDLVHPGQRLRLPR